MVCVDILRISHKIRKREKYKKEIVTISKKNGVKEFRRVSFRQYENAYDTPEIWTIKHYETNV